MEIVFVRHGESTANEAGVKNISFDPHNVVLTSKGKEQSKLTGEYLKIFGKFDTVITSPIVRCVETTKIIVSKINFKDEVITDDRIIEIGEHYDALEGLNKEQANKIIPAKLKSLGEQINLEPNPFKKIKIAQKYSILATKTIKYDPTPEESWNNYVDFLNDLKKRNYSRVLVVTHGGTIEYTIKILCGLNINNDWIRVGTIGSTKWMNNCSITCIQYHNKTDTFELISAPNDSHL